MFVLATTALSFQSTEGASLGVYLSSPGTETTFVPGAATETFNSLPVTGSDSTPYSSSVGTYQFSTSNPGAIVAADQYGGAGGTGRYLALGAQSGTSAPITINLAGAENYFGFWFSAGDSNNGISFYSGNTLLAHYSTASILTLLGNSTVTAIDNTTYQSSRYFGNPNSNFLRQNGSEPYAYVDIVATGVTFNKVVLDNSGATASGFESDNHSIYSGSVTVPGGDVLVTNITVVPEPSQYAAMMAGLLFCLVLGQRLLKKLMERMPFLVTR